MDICTSTLGYKLACTTTATLCDISLEWNPTATLCDVSLEWNPSNHDLHIGQVKRSRMHSKLHVTRRTCRTRGAWPTRGSHSRAAASVTHMCEATQPIHTFKLLQDQGFVFALGRLLGYITQDQNSSLLSISLSGCTYPRFMVNLAPAPDSWISLMQTRGQPCVTNAYEWNPWISESELGCVELWHVFVSDAKPCIVNMRAYISSQRVHVEVGPHYRGTAS
jgi:hypothetical protein